MVYVISKDGKPLMPCENVIARFLLESGKAKVKRKEPFTIKLLYETTTYTQPLTLGVDTGSGTAGFAVSNEKNEIIYASEIIVRNDVKYKMDQRKMNRNNRRIRKTRYRKPRFNNRKNCMKKNHIFPTLISKIYSHEKEIEYIKGILPITKLVLEVGRFNHVGIQNQSLSNSNAIYWGYWRGRNYEFANTKAKVRFRDNNTCQICHGKSKDHKLHVHHIIFRCDGGSDHEDNLITLCETCHKKLHAGLLTVNLNGKKKGLVRHVTHMNIIGSQLLKRHQDAIETFGYITSTNRLALGLVKYSHWMDAVIIATCGNAPIFNKTDVIYIKRCNSRGDYKLSKGPRGEFRMPRGKVCGFLRYDKVKYRSKEYFIKGRKVDGGYADLMDIYGVDVKFSYLPRGNKTPKLRNMVRISARSSWMIMVKKIEPVVG